VCVSRSTSSLRKTTIIKQIDYPHNTTQLHLRHLYDLRYKLLSQQRIDKDQWQRRSSRRKPHHHFVSYHCQQLQHIYKQLIQIRRSSQTVIILQIRVIGRRRHQPKIPKKRHHHSRSVASLKPISKLSYQVSRLKSSSPRLDSAGINSSLSNSDTPSNRVSLLIQILRAVSSLLVSPFTPRWHNPFRNQALWIQAYSIVSIFESIVAVFYKPSIKSTKYFFQEYPKPVPILFALSNLDPFNRNYYKYKTYPQLSRISDSSYQVK